MFRYVNETTKSGLLFEKSDEQTNPVEGFVDADFARNIDTRKSLINQRSYMVKRNSTGFWC